MAGRWRIVPMIAGAIVFLGIVVVTTRVGDAAERHAVVRGIVEYVQGDVVTVARKTYDLKGARLQDGNGVPMLDPPDLRGRTVEILIKNGKIDTVTVYRTLPQ